MRIWFDKFHPGYFGKVGMREYFSWKKGKEWCPTINVDSLWALAGEDAYKAAVARQKSGDKKAVVLDIRDRGYAKVLGKGKLPKLPIIVRARYFSKDAEKKIKEAGGICELRA
jgi:large subunit ribosomal protein L27Ae